MDLASECDINVNKNDDDGMDMETGFNAEDNTATAGMKVTFRTSPGGLKDAILHTVCLT